MSSIIIKPSTTVSQLIDFINEQFDDAVNINIQTLKGNVAGGDRKLRALTDNDLTGGVEIKAKKSLSDTLSYITKTTGIRFVNNTKPTKKGSDKNKENLEVNDHDNYIKIIVEGSGFQVNMYDVENAGVDEDNLDSDYWWNDNWQLEAMDKSEELINYVLPEYVVGNKITIEYKGKKTEYDVDDFESNYNLDKIYSTEIWSNYLKPKAPKSGEKILLFSFGTEGTYDFKRLNIGNSKFDPSKLKINRLRSIACLENDLIESFVYDGNKSESDSNSFEQTPYQPELLSIIELEDPKYQDNFQSQELFEIYMPLYHIAIWKNEPKALDLEYLVDNDSDVLIDLITSPQCPKKLLDYIHSFLSKKKLLDEAWTKVFKLSPNFN